jgi:hypothetical protein
MASADDDFDDEGDTSEEPSCPHCGAENDDCGHLLACIDVTFGEILGGTFYDRQEQAVEVMNQAVVALLRALKKRGQDMKEIASTLQKVQLYRLHVLVKEVQEETGKSLVEEGMRTCYGAFLRYLDDLFEEMPGVVPTEWDFEGGPGMSSLDKLYWSESAEQAAADALRQIEQEADSLRCLT